GRDQTCFIHCTLVPYIAASGELKTKPTQHSVKELRSIGIQPDSVLCRSDREIPAEERRKIALFCNVKPSSVIQALDVSTIYEVPLSYHAQGLDDEVLATFRMENKGEPPLERWQTIVKRVKEPEGEVKIAIVGKYTGLKDAYKSLNEALAHGGIANNVRVKAEWLESEIFEEPGHIQHLEDVHAILVPGGFGERGTKGKIEAVRFARTRGVPFFGICFGLQMAVIEAARNLVGIEGASSTEFGPCKNAVVGLMTEWIRGNMLERRQAGGEMGGTMRLGKYPAHLVPGTKVAEIYGKSEIEERHRHRYEVNVEYRQALEKIGFIFSG